MTSKFGLLVKFGPSYSPWSNDLNKRNHASADITIKKLMEEEKVALSNSLVKVAAWTHNTSVSKLGYSPLQLVTGQVVTIPGLTTRSIATESMTDSESDMRRKLKECQDICVQEYQHRGNYAEGDKVWFQPLNGNTWLGLATVVCQ